MDSGAGVRIPKCGGSGVWLVGGTLMFGMNEDGSESGAAGSYYSNLVIVNAAAIHFESPADARVFGRTAADYGILPSDIRRSVVPRYVINIHRRIMFRSNLFTVSRRINLP